MLLGVSSMQRPLFSVKIKRKRNNQNDAGVQIPVRCCKNFWWRREAMTRLKNAWWTIPSHKHFQLIMSTRPTCNTKMRHLSHTEFNRRECRKSREVTNKAQIGPFFARYMTCHTLFKSRETRRVPNQWRLKRAVLQERGVGICFTRSFEYFERCFSSVRKSVLAWLLKQKHIQVISRSRERPKNRRFKRKVCKVSMVLFEL